jgi:hypothetical protein
MCFQLGNSMGIVKDVETEEDGVGWGTYLMVKIKLDIAKPLARGRVLKLQGNNMWVAFQYERLPKFCYYYGIIKHGVAGCLSRKGSSYHGDSSTQQVGSWLWVFPIFNRANSGRGWSCRNDAAYSPSQAPSGDTVSPTAKGSQKGDYHMEVVELSEGQSAPPLLAAIVTPRFRKIRETRTKR